MEQYKRSCSYCDNRHGGCMVEYSSDNWKSVSKGKECTEFILGKCYFCALHQLEDESLCNYVFYPCGCENFKEGNNYDEYLEIKRHHSTNNEHNDDIDSNIALQSKQIEKNKCANRIKSTKRYNRKMLRKAKENNYIRGPWYNEDKDRVIICDRGKRSKWLKKQAHKKVRRKNFISGLLFNKSQYNKQYDYWWELD